MTREDVIRMAREAGFDMPEKVATTDSDWHAFEVEQIWQRIERLVDIAQAAEREACARVCEAQRDARIEAHPARVEFSDNAMSLRCAAAIRARGEK